MAQCTEEVWPVGGWRPRRCQRTATRDEVNGRFTKCHVHSIEGVAKRRTKDEGQRNKVRILELAKKELASAKEDMEHVLRDIAGGGSNAQLKAKLMVNRFDLARSQLKEAEEQ